MARTKAKGKKAKGKKATAPPHSEDTRQGDISGKKRGWKKVWERKEGRRAAGNESEKVALEKFAKAEHRIEANETERARDEGPKSGRVKQFLSVKNMPITRTVDTRVKSSQELTELVQFISAPNNVNFNKMKPEPRVRPIELRPNQHLNLKWDVNVTAAMAYIKGIESKSPCNRCTSRLGPFCKCVVHPKTMDGACAGCYYRGQGAKCSFNAMVPSQDVRGKSAKQLADEIEARTDVTNTTFLKLQAEPRKRDVEVRDTAEGVYFNKARNALSAMVYMKGNEQEQMCTRCDQGMGPYVKCVVAEGVFGGACAGCHYGSKRRHCNLFKATAKASENASKQIAATTNKASSPPALPKPETRKRKADDLGDLPKSDTEIAKKPRMEGGSKKWAKALQKLEKHVKKAQDTQKILSGMSGSVGSANVEARKQLRKLGKHIGKMYTVHGKLDSLTAGKDDDDEISSA